MRQLTTIIVAAVTIFAMAAGSNAQTTDSGKKATLPGGSSSLQESFENWTVRCAATDKGRVCNAQQQQRHRETNQLVLAVELTTNANGVLNGLVVLPFGLRLADGAVLQIDDQPPSSAIAFSTCLPVGCLIPLSFDKTMIGVLRAGTVLKVGATTNEEGKKIALSVSLKGLPLALDRLAALAHPGAPPAEKKK
ncbi:MULTISPECIES: invasion associated locus B family protein [Bradyrhizobium]|uniref:invasion associated locus B family protein n=1 Tax=Bradyrhizobium elkanii TaxID=29448 RepID=UPI0004035F97|nr:invasion associated locus B family protein [Bradyrhizobium elkanii]